MKFNERCEIYSNQTYAEKTTKGAIVFSGGVHDISNFLIKGPIMLLNGAIVNGKNVTINMKEANGNYRFTRRELKPFIDHMNLEREWWRSMLSIDHRNVKRFKECPIFITGASTLSIPGARIVMQEDLVKALAITCFKGSIARLDRTNWEIPGSVWESSIRMGIQERGEIKA